MDVFTYANAYQNMSNGYRNRIYNKQFQSYRTYNIPYTCTYMYTNNTIICVEQKYII